MRIGISICSNYRVTDPREGARYMIERARVARTADLDSLFVGDHHVTPTNYYQNNPILGRLLAEWHNKPVGALYLLPLWHPVLLAEQIATLASIASGRFIMQCGLGGDAEQSAGMGVEMRDRVGMFEASLSILRALWAGETVNHERYWNIRDARINPLPPQPVDVWVGSVAPAAINRTARIGDGWLASPGLTPAQANDQLNQYRQACAEHQREPSAVAVRRDIFIGATDREVKQMRQNTLANGYRGFSEEALVIGTVAEVAEQMSQLGEAGFTDIIVRNISQDQAEALATIERLGEVKRRLNS